MTNVFTPRVIASWVHRAAGVTLLSLAFAALHSTVVAADAADVEGHGGRGGADTVHVEADAARVGTEVPNDVADAGGVEVDAAPAGAGAHGTLAERVREHLEKTHERDWVRFDLLDVRWTNGAPPEGATLGPISGGSNPTANGTLILYADLERASHAPIRLPITVTIRPWVKAPVASRDLARGVLLTSADMRLEERPLADLRGGTIAAAALNGAPCGLRARQSLQTGAILTTANVDVAPVVASGDRVTIRLASGPIHLAVQGIARRSGRPGETIPVENVDSRKTLLASVVDARTVEVHP